MCKFCEDLQFSKQLDAESEYADRFSQEYTVAIVKRQWLTGRCKRTANRSINFRYQGIGYKLNYCPECGKSMR